uniref:Uncharacterized protein n=1 Tax=Trichuris muris TaxID=70415 RepID=A0A5S6Q7K1_TRIMR
MGVWEIAQLPRGTGVEGTQQECAVTQFNHRQLRAVPQKCQVRQHLARRRNAWNRLQDEHGTLATSVHVDADKDVQEIIDALKSTFLCCECSKPDVDRWLESDSHYRGFQLMNDEEIIEFCSKQRAAYEEEQHSDDDDEKQVVLPSNNEAFYYLEAALTWFEGQEECDSKRLFRLKRLVGSDSDQSVACFGRERTAVVDYLSHITDEPRSKCVQLCDCPQLLSSAQNNNKQVKKRK